MVRMRILIVSLLLLVGLSSMAHADAADPEVEARAYAPAYENPGPPPFPAYNAPNAAKLALGKRLFFDERLSFDRKTSCATCHRPNAGFEDSVPLALNARGDKSNVHTPTIWGLAWATRFGWAGRKPTIEAVILGALAHSHGFEGDLMEVSAFLDRDEELTVLAHQAFPGKSMGSDAVVLAIAAYTRTLTGGETAFDAWVAGDIDAINASQKRGFVVFNEQAGCAVCHDGWTFTDHAVHDVGLTARHRGDLVMTKTPTLRDVARRAPYLHDGRAADLASVIQHYNEGRRARETVHPAIQPLGLSAIDQKDLIAFLNTLTEPVSTTTLPPAQ